MNWLQNIVNKFAGQNKYFVNSFGNYANWTINQDYTHTWAIETAFASNPDVYAIIQQRAKKLSQVPFYVKKVENQEKRQSLEIQRKHISLQSLKLKNDSFNKEYVKMPLEKPNALMGWEEFFQLAETYLALTGNLFIYEHKDDLDIVRGYYVLPSHFIKIWLKKEVGFEENPIDFFELTYVNGQSVPFEFDEIIHVKYANPEWNTDGRQLYGFSPLKASYFNVENVIQANKHLHKMFKSSGAFGFMFAKGERLTPDQAKSFKERIIEMDKSKDRLAKIDAVAQEVGFTRIALGNKDLMPWDSLNHDRKTICNVLGWSDELLNNDGKSRLGGDEANEARKRVLTDTILPDLQLIEKALTERFRMIKGYENTELFFDITEMPEMQEDIQKIISWAEKAPITINEFRELIKYEKVESETADKILISRGKMILEDLEMSGFDSLLNPEPNE